MKKFRLSVLLLVLALVVAIVPAVFAQDTLGASQGDYDLWTSANTTSAAFNTVTYDFTAKLAVTGMQDASQNVTADLKGTGVIDKTDTNNPAFQLDVTGTVTQGTQNTPVNVGVRITGGNVYYNDGTGWKGQPLSNLSSDLSQGMASTGMSATPEMSNPAAGLASLESNPQAQAMIQALSQLKPSDFLTLTRSDANGLAHFTLNIDIAKLLSSPSFTQFMNSAMAASASAAGPDATPSVDAAQMQQGMAMAQMVFQQAKINIDQDIDPNSKMVSQTVFDLNLPLDTLMGQGAGVTANFDINLSNYNQPVTVTAPADAVMATPEASS